MKKTCFLHCQVPAAAAAQGYRNFHFSIYGKKNNAKVSDDVSHLTAGCLQCCNRQLGDMLSFVFSGSILDQEQHFVTLSYVF